MYSRSLKAPFLAAACLAVSLLSLNDVLRAEEPLPSVERLKTSPVLRHLQPNPMSAAPRTGPEQTVAQMFVPKGFRAELVVAEPDLHQPVAFAFDERGRIWVAEAYSYPQKQAEGQGLDKIVIFEDRDGDGRFEYRKVFAEQLNLVSGFELGFGGVWVGAAPELIFIADRNRDDVPDGPPQVLLNGFGYQDTHECLNSFLWGPDGWLYGIQGVFNLAHIGKPGAPDSERKELRAGVWRYHPVRHEFEIYAHGGSNPWGIDYDERGQLFMTHCRSYWGRGGTTHVLQGGQFWNQANANYAPFIIANPPSEFPGFRNFLLASARYDHGAGGAGVPGSDAIYGGHSHVGTMIYLGDNWPAEYRGHLFTHNLGGHQINQQVNRRWGSGFDTVHAGRDLFFCSDPKYVAVDLQSGPDGAVYMIDWYDQQHCHNPNTERWDRSNGRIYRLQWQATFKPAQVNLGSLSDTKLVELLRHKNGWHARTARRLLQERAQSKRPIETRAKRALLEMAQSDADPARRLHGLWTLHAIGGITDDVAKRVMADSDEFVRGWMIQLALDDRAASEVLLNEFDRLAQTDPSPVVRRYLASAVQRVSAATAWKLIRSLSQHGEDREDRNLPLLLWHGMAPLVAADLDQAFAVAKETLLPQVADWMYWYAATLEGDGLNRSIGRLEQISGEEQRRTLAGIALAMESRANVPAPASWKRVGPMLYGSRDSSVQRQAERLAAAFGDDSMFPRLRETLASKESGPELRKHAFSVLSRAQDRRSVPVFIRLLEEGSFRIQALSLLARFDNVEIPGAIITRLDTFSAAERNAALNTLASRPSFARTLLDAISGGQVKRDLLTAYHVRQLTQLKDSEVDKRVTAAWGRIVQSPAEKQMQIARLEKVFNEAPLWAYDARAGRQHFQKLCAQCHRIGEEGVRLGPELTGTGKNGIRYLLENIVDPNAVIGTDFQMTTLETRAGDVVSGVLSGETASTVTIRTTVGESVIAKAEIAKRETSDKSLMPEGLIESLKDREQLELLKFLSGN